MDRAEGQGKTGAESTLHGHAEQGQELLADPGGGKQGSLPRAFRGNVTLLTP